MSNSLWQFTMFRLNLQTSNFRWLAIFLAGSNDSDCPCVRRLIGSKHIPVMIVLPALFTILNKSCLLCSGLKFENNSETKCGTVSQCVGRGTPGHFICFMSAKNRNSPKYFSMECFVYTNLCLILLLLLTLYYTRMPVLSSLRPLCIALSFLDSGFNSR